MARVTVEDCVLRVPNRFELVMLAAQRAKEISSGSPLTVDRDNDKNAVVALREIADKTVNLEDLNESVVQGLQKHVEIDEIEEEKEEFDLAAPAIGADDPDLAVTGLATEALAVETSSEAGDPSELKIEPDVESEIAAEPVADPEADPEAAIESEDGEDAGK